MLLERGKQGDQSDCAIKLWMALFSSRRHVFSLSLSLSLCHPHARLAGWVGWSTPNRAQAWPSSASVVQSFTSTWGQRRRDGREGEEELPEVGRESPILSPCFPPVLGSLQQEQHA